MTSVDPTVVRERVLEPAMDSIALNNDQRALIYNPSPEVDSLIEIAQELVATGADPALMARKMLKLRLLLESIGREDESLRMIACAADMLAKRKKVGDELTVNGLARHLRPHLSVLLAMDRGDSVDAMDVVLAGGALRRVCDMNPPALLRPSLRNQLGPVQHGKLMEVWAEFGGEHA